MIASSRGKSNFGGYDDNPLLAELYDLVPGYASRPDVGFYLDLCRATRGKILEVGCGTGRILIPAAAEGAEIVGLDVSPYMVAKCRDKLSAQPPETRARVRLVEASMVDFHLNDRFSLAIMPFRPLQHLVAIEDQLSCLCCIGAHLERGGRLVFDVFQVDFSKITAPTRTEESEDLPEMALPDGRRLRRTSRLVATHRAEQYNDVEMIYYLTGRDGAIERIVQAFPFRYFFRYEVEHLLALCGLKTIELYGDFKKTPFRDDSPEMVFVAERG
jgi:SAM-dependent methyltransferase